MPELTPELAGRILAERRRRAQEQASSQELTPELAGRILAERRRLAQAQAPSQELTPELAGRILAERARRRAASTSSDTGFRNLKKDIQEDYDKSGAPKNVPWDRKLGMAARSGVGAVAGLGDLALLPSNLIGAASGKWNPWSPSEAAKSAVDTLTGDRYKPMTTGEKIGSAALESVGGVGALGKLASKAVGKLAARRAATTGAQEAGRGERFASRLADAGAPTAANLTGAGLGGLTTEALLQGENPNVPSAVIGGILGNILGSKATRGAQRFIGKDAPGFKLNTAGVAIRHPVIGAELSAQIPDKVALRNLIEQSTPDKIGKKVFDQATQYHHDRSMDFGARKGAINSEANYLNVNLDDPLAWSTEFYKSVEAPFLKEDYLKSPLGKLTSQVYGYKNSPQGRAKFAKAIEKDELPIINPSHGDTNRLLQKIQNTISQSDWNRYGNVDVKEVKGLRYGVKSALHNAVGGYSPSLLKRLEQFNNDYRRYEILDEPVLNQIKKSTNLKPRESAAIASETLKDTAYTPEAIMRFMKTPHDKEDMALHYIRQMGIKDGVFDSGNFYSQYHNAPQATQALIRNNLTKPVGARFDRMMKMQKNYQRIADAKDEFGDILLRKQGLDWKSKVISWAKKNRLEKYWDTPEKKATLYRILEEEPAGVGKYSLKPEAMSAFRRATGQQTVQGLKKTDRKERERALKVRLP